MANWSKNKTLPANINSGNEYAVNDNVSLENLNAITNNSFYAVDKAEEAKAESAVASQEAHSAFESKNQNPNLLVNGDFRVNQRGLSNYVGGVYTVDCWRLLYGGTLDVLSNGNVKLTASDGTWRSICQFIENFKVLFGKKVTLSATYNSASTVQICVDVFRGNNRSSLEYKKTEGTSSNFVTTTVTAEIPNDNTITKLGVQIFVKEQNGFAEIKNVKLELGEVATNFCTRPYSEELAMCQMPFDTNGISTIFSNPNLLINGNFRVNQRGLTTYNTLNNYTVDRWKAEHSGTTVAISTNGVSVSLSTQYAKFGQIVEDYEWLKGKQVTISAKISNYVNTRSSDTVFQINDGVSESIRVKLTDGIVTATGTISSNATKVYVMFYNYGTGSTADTFDIEWAKLELGEVATPFSPRPYAEELAMCQRYYQVVKVKGGSGTVGNLGFVRNSTTLRFYINLLAELRTAPTLSNSSTSILNLSSGNVVQINDNSLTLQCMMNNQIVLNYTGSGMTAGTPYNLTDADGKLKLEFDAEIY